MEELFYGCQKEIHFKRHAFVSDKAEKVVECSRIIEVKPGMGHNELRYSGEGHHRFAQKPGDLVVKFSQKPHQKFKRQNNDIIYLHKISLLDSLKSSPVHFTTIDNQMMEAAVDEVISQKTEKVIPNMGMPILNNDPLGPIKRNFQRGNLIIRFDIQFPTELSDKQRLAIT